MLKFNAYVFYMGIILTITAVVVGFPALFFLNNQSLAIICLFNLAPFGFLLWFTGFVGYTFLRPNRDRKERTESEEYQRQVPD